MSDLCMDVDVALAEVPVNLLPLLDDTDFKTIEGAVVYNAAGMALRWHFVTTAGAYTVTTVTPTTGGDYDWTDQGDAGVYTIEIPASAGASINNDTEGFGWFTGVATGVLPWRGPVICFRAVALNNSLIDAGATGLLAPATAARTLVVDAAGLADANIVKLGPTGSGSTQTARDVGASVLVSPGTGTGQLDITSGVVKANLVQILAAAITGTAAQIVAAFTKWFNVATPTGTVNSLPDAAAEAAGGLYTRGTGAGQIRQQANGQIDVNVESILNDYNTAEFLYQQQWNGTAVTGTLSSTQATTNLTGYGDDVFNHRWLIYWTSGARAVQMAIVTDYDSATGMLTWSPALTGGAPANGDAFVLSMVAGGLAVGDRTGMLSGAVGSVTGFTPSDIATILARLSPIATKTGAVVTDGGNSATSFKTDLTETPTDHFKDAFLRLTSGALVNQVKKITAYNGTTKVITVASGFTATPADGVSFEVIND